MIELETFIEKSKPFMAYMLNWQNNLPEEGLAELVADHPDRVAIISVDVINGFCYEGPLASPRVANIVEPIAQLFAQGYEAGIRHFAVTQDAHQPDSVEFANYPPHCIRGTSESDTVAAFKALPFWNEVEVIEKESINSAINTRFEAWLNERPQLDTFIAVGDCTDLCTYQLAMHLKLRGNSANKAVRVIVPVNCVDTYDLPVSTAQEIGAVPHDGDFLHTVFLYSMMLNGIEVVSAII